VESKRRESLWVSIESAPYKSLEILQILDAIGGRRHPAAATIYALVVLAPLDGL
jgi:hypothetical protein